MMRILLAWAVSVSLFVQASVQAQDATPAPRVVLLKFDDLRADKASGVSAKWMAVVDFVERNGIKANIGIIGSSLAEENPAYIQWIQGQNAAGRIEFWNHGYTHGKRKENGQDIPEFKDTLEKQREAFVATQQLAVSKLGFPFRAFGSPFNAINADTATVLSEDKDMQVWMYGNPAFAKQNGFTGVVLDRKLNFEAKVAVPDFAAFEKAYPSKDLGNVITLQAHPAGWDKAGFAEAQKIIDLLKTDGWQFKTISEYLRDTATPQASGN